MGRRKTSNAVDKANVVSQPENTIAGNSNLSANKVDLPDESKNATLNRVESLTKLQVYTSRSSSRKTAGSRGTPVRKSQRLQNVALDAPMLELKRITEEIIASDDDDDDEQQPVDDAGDILEDKNLEEKVEYLLRVCEEHQEALDALKSKMAKGAPGVTSGAGEATYKSLYIDSQKKIEASVEERHQLMKKIEDLQEENHQLNKKLEHSLGKIEVGNLMPSNLMEKWNAVYFCPSLGKDSETACKVFAEAMRGAFPASITDLAGMPCAKRKKSAKETKNL